MMQNDFEERLVQSLEKDLPYLDRTHRELVESRLADATPSAVLVLFGFHQSLEKPGPSLLYIRRTDSVETHKGQMAFPGGVCDASDLDQPESTALRETQEEVGIPGENIRVLGRLPSLVTATGFLIHPIVGVLLEKIEMQKLLLSSLEAAEAVWIPLTTLEHPDVYRREFLKVKETEYPIDVYQVQDYRIWGATGSMTKNLLDRFKGGPVAEELS